MPSDRRPGTSADPGPLIGSGRAADGYDLGDGRVLRRNRSGAETDREAAVMRHLGRHGYPVPQVHGADGADLVMERVDGPTMLEAFGSRPWRIRSWARLLASLHHRLERVPVPDLDLPERFGAPEVVVHGDLHPGNVMLAPGGPLVIDWSNTGVGPLGTEAATTWVIVATSEIDTGGLLGRLQRSARSHFLSAFLDRVDRDAARALLAPVAAHRLNDRNLRPAEATAIHRLLDEFEGG